ncbi:UDP-N-acetylmuramoylalanine--D-glutamate ligase [Alphaproteobacteria bacterium SO-S41]|nr:UDP-N-acetylmuramoylalanine--D-glutamate ligase [Alphaproteobacteria bacterium SO-S41]
MIPVPLFPGQTVAVLGLARSGLSAARALIAGGANVVAWDDQEKGRAAAEGELLLREPAMWNWSQIKALVLSPGIPLTHPKPHPVAAEALARGIEVIGDVELFYRTLKHMGHVNGNGGAAFFSQGPVNPTHGLKGNGNGNVSKAKTPLICITGTNGKSTTTALIGHLLAKNGWDAQVGGNIGKPVLELGPPREGTAYVLELSSYQLDLSPTLKPSVALLLNITPDHLERHGGMAGYIAAKRRIFARQGTGDLAVIGVDTTAAAETCTYVSARGGPTVAPISVDHVIGRGIYALDGVLYDGLYSPPAEIVDLKNVASLPGAHNWENAAAAYAAVRGYIKDPKAIGRAFASFPGLPHRIEAVGKIGKVRLFNDSKATNADAAAKALAAYPKDIYWILGGRAKEGGIESLARYFPRVKHAYLVGEATEEFAATLDKGGPAYTRSASLAEAARAALAAALAGEGEAPIVLFSPAGASFDQFKDFEDRGNHFRRIVAELARGNGAAAAA